MPERGVNLNTQRCSCQEKGMFSSEKDGRQGTAKLKGKAPSGERIHYLTSVLSFSQETGAPCRTERAVGGLLSLEG